MKKNFIKVSVICALAMASSTAVVSCSDYDDDLKNHQEQIDALKKQLDASKTEITDGLNTAIEGLKEEIKNVAGSKADATVVKALEEKAAELQAALDQKASKEEIAALSEEVKGLIADVNQELSAAMESTKGELQGQVDDLKSKQDELNQKLEDLANQSGNIEDIQAELDKVSGELDKVSNDLKDALNQLKVIEDAKYGEQIAELATKVKNLEGLEAKVNGYTDAEIANLETKLTGQIKDAIEAAKEDISTEFAGKLTTLEGKFNEYITKNAMQPIIDFIGELSAYEGQTLKALLDGKASAQELTNLTARVNALETAVDVEGKISDAIKAESEALKKEFNDILGLMIQSIAYVPTYDNNTGNITESPVRFNNLYVKKQINGSWTSKKVAEKIDNTVTFRVTPAAAAEKFLENYDIRFEGDKASIQTRAAQPSRLNVNIEKSTFDASKGTVTLYVTRNEEEGIFPEGTYYALCAHITAKTKEGETKNPTDISSDFFLANHQKVTVDEIVYESGLANNTYDVAWNNTEKSFNLAEGAKLVGKLNHNTIDSDLEKTFGNVFSVSYAMKKGNQSPFTVSPSGIVKIKNGVSSAIDQKDYVVATVTPNNTGFNYTTELTGIEFKVTKDLKTYDKENITVNWANVATAAYTYDLNLTEIANTFEVGVADLKNIIANAEKTSNENDVDVTVSYGNNNDKISITLKEGRHSLVEKELVINLKDQAGSTTQTSSEYQIKVKIGATIYPTFTLPKQSEIWDAAQKKVIVTPKFTTDADGVVSAMTLKVDDITTIYKDYNNTKNDIAGKHASHTISIPAVNGVSAVNYNSVNSPNNKTLTITQSAYTGADIKAISNIVFDNNQPASGMKEEFVFGLETENQFLAGTFNAPGNDYKIRMKTKNEVKNIENFTWTDYKNRVMWKDGVKQIRDNSVEALKKAMFSEDPFGDDIYAMDAPTFELNDKYLQVDRNTGEITFKDDQKGVEFQSDYKTKLKVTIVRPQWGDIRGNISGKLNTQQNKYILEYEVIIPKGIQ